MGKKIITRFKIWGFILAGTCVTIGLVVPLLITSLMVFLMGALFKDSLIRRVGLNMLISVDQFANVVLLGDPDETISSRTGRAINSGKPVWIARCMHVFVDRLFRILLGQKNHCIDAVEGYRAYPKEIWCWIKGSNQ